ncbi:LacI family DNA-binding transcriptional regulator [Microbacterium sp. ARD32]|uniref:LacI family DNA-binding transcriptional regulator n=1 Tax=Microbacterium sp. ARD32 TaxID=2962577 RepID=UPI00288126C6|nr:LacI family DNA-binding transcriptional regulator [Microbacterium sp. ARD32]MDT0158014.1 LacI family DNA-binding transcriptional regulator [Microbacterium sp. ARD32]
MARSNDESVDAAGRPTMKDVAARAGVGLSTVSRVVAGKGGVSRTRTRAVERAIAELEYSRNDFAHTLRTGSARTIGVVVTRISDPFYAEVVFAIEQRAQERDLLVLVASTGDDPAEGERVLRRMLSRRLDGLIVVAHEEADVSFLAAEKAAGTRIVFIDRPPHGLSADLVIVDNERGAADAVAHLARAGHRSIACLAHTAGRFTSERRQAGFRQGVRDAGLPTRPELIVAVDDDVDVCVEALRELASLDDPPTALVTTNSRTTKAVLKALRLLDAHPAMVGFDDFDLAELMTPPVTSIAQDPWAIGEAAADLLLDRIAGLVGPDRRIVLGTRLVERGSGEQAPAGGVTGL